MIRLFDSVSRFLAEKCGLCDIRGAQMVGIRAGIFNPAEDGHVEGQDGTIVADFEIKTYPELLKVLGIARK